MEWNVEITQYGSTTIGKPAILTIGSGTSVHILQIASYVHEKKLLPLLTTFLTLPNVQKIDVGIKNDLQ